MRCFRLWKNVNNHLFYGHIKLFLSKNRKFDPSGFLWIFNILGRFSTLGKYFEGDKDHKRYGVDLVFMISSYSFVTVFDCLF
jgi:hypothetical protein